MNACPFFPPRVIIFFLFVTSYGDRYRSISLHWNLHMFLARGWSFLSCIFARDPAKGLHANQLGSFEEGRIAQCSSWDCVRGLWVSWGSESIFHWWNVKSENKASIWFIHEKLIKCLSLWDCLYLYMSGLQYDLRFMMMCNFNIVCF